MADIEITFTEQAKVLLKEMPEIKEEDIIKWKIGLGLELGGGDIVSYLRDKDGNRNTG